MSIAPAATSRRAAARAGSISGSQTARSSRAATALAASDGQIVFPRPRFASRARIISSICLSASVGLRDRHPSEQNRTLSQSLSQRLRHVIVRPQPAQIFGGIAPTTASDLRRGSGTRSHVLPYSR